MQSCVDLSDMNSSNGGRKTPAACQTHEVKYNCPVTCIHELNPQCHDGKPLQLSDGSPLISSTR